MNNILIVVLVAGLLFGFTGKGMIDNINPFKSKPKVVQKSEGYKTEQFRDKIKGIEYRVEEKYKNQAPSKTESVTVGQWIDNLLTNSFKLVVGFLIFCGIVLYFTGFNIIKMILNLRKKLKDTIIDRDKNKKALKQTVKGIEKAKIKLNGEHQKLKDELSKTQDEDTKLLIDNIKHIDEKN